MDNFVDIWKIFNFAFFDFVIVHKLFWQKIEILIKDMQGKFTLVKINEKNMCFGEKDIPIWWSFIFAEGPIFGKIRPCPPSLLIPWQNSIFKNLYQDT